MMIDFQFIVYAKQQSIEEAQMNENLLTVNELAEYLSVPKSWVYARNRETGPDAMPRIVCGKYRRYRLADVMAWLEEMNKDA